MDFKIYSIPEEVSTQTLNKASSTVIESGDLVALESWLAIKAVPNVTAVAQVNTYTVAIVAADAAQTDTITINGTDVSYTSDATPTIAEISAGLVSAINSSSEASSVTASGWVTDIIVTSDTAGTAFTSSVSENITDTATTPNTEEVTASTALGYSVSDSADWDTTVLVYSDERVILSGTADANFAVTDKGIECDITWITTQLIDLWTSTTDVLKVISSEDAGTVGEKTNVLVTINKTL